MPPFPLPPQRPLLGNVQDARRRGFRGRKVAGDNGRKRRVGEKLAEEVVDGDVEVARTDGFLDTAVVEVPHEDVEAGLRRLLGHGGALNGLHGGVGGGLLGLGQGVHVVDDIDGLCDAEGGAHLSKHVVLGLTEGPIHVKDDALELGRIRRASSLERRKPPGRVGCSHG